MGRPLWDVPKYWYMGVKQWLLQEERADAWEAAFVMCRVSRSPHSKMHTTHMVRRKAGRTSEDVGIIEGEDQEGCGEDDVKPGEDPQDSEVPARPEHGSAIQRTHCHRPGLAFLGQHFPRRNMHGWTHRLGDHAVLHPAARCPSGWTFHCVRLATSCLAIRLQDIVA